MRPNLAVAMNGKTLLRHGAVGLLVLVGAALAYWNTRPRAISPELVASKPAWGSSRAHSELLRGVPSIAVEGRDALAPVLDSALELSPTSEARLTPEARAALSLKVSDYLGAFASESPEAYLQLAARETTAWIDPTADAWKPIDHAMEFYYKKKADRGAPWAALAALLDQSANRDRARFTRIGTGPRGMRLLVEFGRTASDVERALLHERGGTDDAARVAELEYWTRGGAHGIRFREPQRSVEDIVRAHRGVLFVQTAIVVLTAEGKPGVWHGTWYWDPDAGEWLNRRSFIESFHGLIMYY